MENQVYFIGTAENSVELAEKNVPFYTWFVSDCGSSPVHACLWTGQTLRDFIVKFSSCPEASGSKKVKRLLRIYIQPYKKLTGQKFKLKNE